MRVLMLVLAILVVCSSGEAQANQLQWKVLGNTSLGTFREVDTQEWQPGKRYPINHQWIATPTGKVIQGAPYGLQCDHRRKFYCSFGFIVEPVQGEVFLVTSGQLYQYRVSTDDFALVLQYRKSPFRHVKGQRGEVVACTGGSSGAQLGGLLAYVQGTWKFISPPKGRERRLLPTRLQSDHRGIWMTLPGFQQPLFYDHVTGRWQ